MKNQFLSILPTVNYTKQVYRKLCSYFQISYGEGEYSTYDFNFNAFCKAYNFSAILCYNALQLLDRNSVINLSKQFKNKVTAQFITSSSNIFNYLDTHQDLNPIVKSMLRMYGGISDYETNINTLKISEKASVTESILINALIQLEKDNIITLNLKKTDAQITFIQPREDDKTINRIAKTIEQQNKLKQKQVQSVLNYIENDSVCKSIQLLSYFGEKDLKPCGTCSVCISSQKKSKSDDIPTLKKRIIELLEKEDLSSRVLISYLKCSEDDLKTVLKLLLEHNIITITQTNTYKLSHL